jgi:FlaA1/EpsC-like NDP-sugar epimerase
MDQDLEEKIINMFNNKTICVFGGTGTIGSLIVDYLLTQEPKTIRIFSNDEDSLWKAQRKWNYGNRNNIRYLLGDIRNLERCRIALKNVDFVFNAAAIKHVPFAEYNPMEAVNVNINGLNNIIQACVERKAKKLLHISTDKAVKPTTVMGATKFIGEQLVQMRWAQNPEVDMVCVRLGNVWDSRGSIVPLIHECMKKQKPIPLTSPKMERYFMQPEEVTEFIIDSFKNGEHGEIRIPKLKVVKILDIMRGEAGVEYPFEEIGIRKGEKISEELISEEELNFAIEFEDKWIIENMIK